MIAGSVLIFKPQLTRYYKSDKPGVRERCYLVLVVGVERHSLFDRTNAKTRGLESVR